MSTQTHRELRDRAAAEAWLAAGLCLVRLSRPSAGAHQRVAPWLLGVLSESSALPPAGVIADVGHLLLGASLRSIPPLPAVDDRLAAAVRAYEDQVLGRLEADPRLDAAMDAIARLPAAERDRAIAVFSTHLLQRLGTGAAVAVSPGVVRRIVQRPVDELTSTGQAALSQAGEISGALATGYRGLVAGARRQGMLISEAEIFLLENLEALGDLTQRVAIEQIIQAADAFATDLPRHLKPKTRRERERIPTPMAAEDDYPAGGFSALSTSGSMENLVVSELVYMDEHEDDIDLFDLRYTEGELLYYTRDESVLVRGQRVITFALTPDLQRARVKDAALPWQRLVIALGLVTCCIRRLAGWLAREGLLFRVVFIGTAEASGEPPLLAEQGLCALALRDLAAKGVVEIARAADASTVTARAREHARTARTEIIAVSTRPGQIAPADEVPLGTLCLDDVPRLVWAHRPEPIPDRQGQDIDLWEAWLEAASQLLQELL